MFLYVAILYVCFGWIFNVCSGQGKVNVMVKLKIPVLSQQKQLEKVPTESNYRLWFWGLVACNNSTTIPSTSPCEGQLIPYNVSVICHVRYTCQPWTYMCFAETANIMSRWLGLFFHDHNVALITAVTSG